jgi:integrase
MPTNKLADHQCRNARPKDRPYKLMDGAGLFLYVTPAGGRHWRLAFRFEGRPQTLTFGPYPEVGLAAARSKRDEARAVLRDGRNPAAKVVRKSKAPTLATAVETYWAGRLDVSEQYRTNALAAFERHVRPAMGHRPIDEITRAELLEVLLVIDRSGRHDYVRKIRMWLSLVFDWAVELEMVPINPAAQIKPDRAFSKRPVENFAALEPGEIAGFMDRLRMEADIASVAACKLQAYTWTRPTELRAMKLAELDLDAALWRIPAKRMKMSRDHLVPLSRQALKLIRARMQFTRGSEYLFPGEYRTDRTMSENAVLYLIYRLGYKGRMTAHGWRSVASTWANEGGFRGDVIERQLAHSPADQVRAAYNRAEYLPQRRALLQAWADWLDAQTLMPAA